MHIETVTVLEQRIFGGDYRVLKFASGKIAAEVKPGQFIHLRVAPYLPVHPSQSGLRSQELCYGGVGPEALLPPSRSPLWRAKEGRRSRQSPVASVSVCRLRPDTCHREEWRSWLRRVPQAALGLRSPEALRARDVGGCRGVLHERNNIVLRRPFSVFKADKQSLTVLFKIIGKGTKILAQLRAGDKASIIGPLGNGFLMPAKSFYPVFVAGGYGSAALYLLAERTKQKGTLFIGGKTAGDILCAGDFKRLGWNVRIATEDGSAGQKGLVTDILTEYLFKKRKMCQMALYACGPMGMLEAVAKIAIAGDWKAWLSLDKNMGCGVGACLACVQKIRIAGDRGASDSWKWARICTEGPVFECREIVWGNVE